MVSGARAVMSACCGSRSSGRVPAAAAAAASHQFHDSLGFWGIGMLLEREACFFQRLARAAELVQRLGAMTPPVNVRRLALERAGHVTLRVIVLSMIAHVRPK